MKQPLDDLETELSRLVPQRPGPWLETRIRHRLNARPLVRRVRWILFPLGAAAVLALVWASFLPSPQPGPGPDAGGGHLAQRAPDPFPAPLPDPVPDRSSPALEAPSLHRVGQASYLYDAHEDGFVYASDQTSYRRIRYRFLDTAEWRDEATRAVFQVVVPREDILLIPMNVY